MATTNPDPRCDPSHALAEGSESGGLTEEWVARYRHALAHRPVVRALTEAESNVARIVNECRPAIEYYYSLPDPPGHRAGEYRSDMGEILYALEQWSEASETFLDSLKVQGAEEVSTDTPEKSDEDICPGCLEDLDEDGYCPTPGCDGHEICEACTEVVGKPVAKIHCSSLTHVERRTS